MAAYRTHINTWNTTAGTHTATITPAVNDLFIVFCADSGIGHGAHTCSDNNGGTYTKITGNTKNSAADGFSAWVRDALVPNTTSTIVTHAPGGTSTGGGLCVVAVSGMARSGAQAILQSASENNQAGGGTPAPVFGNAVLTGNLTAGMLNGGSGVTPPASTIERIDVGYITPGNQMEVWTRDSGFTGTTVTWGSTSASAFGDIVVELDNSAVPAAAVPYVNRMPQLLAH